MPEEDVAARGPPHRGQELPAHDAERPSGRPVQVGRGRTVKEVAGELACDWHTINDAVTTYGKALLDADRKRMNKTSAIGLDETKFVKLASMSTRTTPRRSSTSRIIRSSTSCRAANMSTWPAGSTNSPRPGRSGSTSGPSTCPPPMPRSTRSCCPEPSGGRRLPCGFLRQPMPRRGAPAGPKRTARAPGTPRRFPLSGPAGAAARRREAR